MATPPGCGARPGCETLGAMSARSTSIDRFYIGRLQPLAPEGQLSGIVKNAVSGPLALGTLGLAGDQQGDPRYHGGPQKALHHYPAEHYARLAALRPALAAVLRPGLLGENLSTTGWTEHEVCVGDIFRLGSARIQVSEPRSPCWKIDHRCDARGVSQLISAEGLTGWYYRVLDEGEVEAGCRFELDSRPAPGITLTRLWAARIAHRPDPAELALLAEAPGLSPAWRKRLAERRDWLLHNG